MAWEVRIELANAGDLPEVMKFLVPAFEIFPVEGVFGRVNTDEGRKAAENHHIRAWELHAEESDLPCAIKCVCTDDSGVDMIVGFCEWWLYPHGRSKEKSQEINYLLSGQWLPDDRRTEANTALQEVFDGRIKWLGQRPAGILMYMVVHPDWRRKGIASLCINWGLDICIEHNMPALLEASEAGVPVYEKLGFEREDEVYGCPLMIRWPAGTPKSDKRPALPHWKSGQ